MGRICTKKKNTGGDTMKQTLKNPTGDLRDPLKHFIPRWTFGIIQAIKEYGDGNRNTKLTFIREQSGDKIDYQDNQFCLVGEGQLFRTSYESEQNIIDGDCNECSNLSHGPAAQAIESKRDLFSFKKELYTHFKDEHPKLYRVWENRKEKNIVGRMPERN